MTSKEMHINFKAKFNRINSNKNKAFYSKEIDLFLNDQMDKFIDNICNPKSNYKGEGFEESEQRLDDIRNIVAETSTNASSTMYDSDHPLTLETFDYGKMIVLPDNYRMLVSDYSDTTVTCGSSGMSPNRVYTNNRLLQQALKDSFHRSHYLSPVSQLINNSLRVYERDFTVTNIYITYIRTYNPIEYEVADCVLPASTHRQIVDMAVSKVNAVINTNNYEKYLNEISKNE